MNSTNFSTIPFENKNFHYIFVDPFGRTDSGVTSYISHASKYISNKGIKVNIISRSPNEPLDSFKKRLADSVNNLHNINRRIIVEAPESDATTADISTNIADLHIRLHCSRQLGLSLQGIPICKHSLQLEQQEINRAKYHSAPSNSAVTASSLLFDLPKKICSYPNPIIFSSNELKNKSGLERNYVLFVGRFHSIKGISWVYELADRLPDIQFFVIAPKTKPSNIPPCPSNIRLVDFSIYSKCNIYQNAKLVIIPSLYETASMVGIEALAADIPIVTWQHLGIVEYASSSMITAVKPFNVDKFAEAIRQSYIKNNVNKSNNFTSNINELFYRGLQGTLIGDSSNFMPIKFSGQGSTITRSVILKLIEKPIMNTSHPIPHWRRKLRKLRRNPILFLRDSKILRPIIDIYAKSQSTSPILSSNSENSAVSKQELKKTELFASIKTNGKIEFKSPPTKPIGMTTALFYPEDQVKYAQKILEGLDVFDDFRYVQQPHLQIATFQKLTDFSIVDFIGRIDIKNKQNIAQVNHIILLTPPPLLVEGLRSCGSYSRTIVILDDAESIPPNPWHTDVLIVVGKSHPVVNEQFWRRKIVVDKTEHLPMAIRRAVQEGAPKSPDMLLPLIGYDGYHRDNLLNNNILFHQGIIRATPTHPRSGKNQDICFELAQNVTDLAVSESVYLRYRNLCDSIDNLESRFQFILYSSYDGVIFDVCT